jgi:hypothetical protein
MKRNINTLKIDIASWLISKGAYKFYTGLLGS